MEYGNSGGSSVFTLIVYIAVCVLLIVINWKIYVKMGRQGWECIIPIYNVYVLFKAMYGNGWKFLLLLIPIYNIYVGCKFCIDMAHRFGKSTGFGVGLIFLSIIFECILAFGDAQFTPLQEAE